MDFRRSRIATRAVFVTVEYAGRTRLFVTDRRCGRAFLASLAAFLVRILFYSTKRVSRAMQS